MKSLQLFLILSLLSLGGCAAVRNDQQGKSASQAPSELVSREERVNESVSGYTQVSLTQADQRQSMDDAMSRKILRNADFQLEVTEPAAAQRQITSLAESLGGFVVTSESKQRDGRDPAKPEVVVSLVVRIPALQFNSALEAIRATAARVVLEKTTGQDVTEEFIDLEARLRTHKALELQFLEIMKQASKVADALEVQRQVAEVRTEIEKLEGRRRFLENRASLSTINITLETPAAIVVNTSGFRRSISLAVSDSLNVAGEIVLFVIRFVIVLIPIFLLIILPGGLLSFYIFRRMRRSTLSELESTPEPMTQG
jgi:hypothetical protein